MTRTHHPARRRRVVGVAIQDVDAREVLRAACAHVGLGTVEVSRAGWASLPGPLAFDLLAYDLAPWSEAIITDVRRLQLCHPRCPILLYRPLTSDAARVAAPLGAEPGIVARVRQPRVPGEIADLALLLDYLGRDVPRRTAETILDGLLDHGPPEIRAFASAGLCLLAQRAVGRPTVTNARELAGLTRNELAAACADHRIPQRSRLLRFVTLLLVTLEADWAGCSSVHAARRLGVDEKKGWPRLRRDLLGPDAPSRCSPGVLLGLTIRALARECGVMPEVEDEALTIASAAPPRPGGETVLRVATPFRHALHPTRRTTSRSRRSPSRSFSLSRSYRAWRFSQKRSDVPKYRASRNAVSALIARIPWTISLIRRGGTVMSFASRYCVSPSGSRNSSSRTSPGCIGASLVEGITRS